METKFIPILYQQDMVLACLDGTKTQTRRIKKLQIVNKNPDEWILDGLQINGNFIFHNINTREEFWVKSPYGNTGDILWVRETFCEPNLIDGNEQDFYYKASTPEKFSSEHRHIAGVKWKPSIHMPKLAARLFLEVKSVKVERLRDISENDAIAEGIYKEKYVLDKNVNIYTNYLPGKDFYSFSEYSWNFGKETHSAAVASYCSLWEEINGDGSWNRNPWVWVIEFEHIHKPDNFI